MRAAKRWELDVKSHAMQVPPKKQRLLDISNVLLAYGLDYHEAVELGRVADDDDDPQVSE